MKIFISLVCSLVMLGTVASSHAGDAAAGKAKSMLCAACHGADGHSLTTCGRAWLAKKEGYLAKQLKAFRDGTRQDPMMAPMAKPLSDDDIANLAAYFNSL